MTYDPLRDPAYLAHQDYALRMNAAVQRGEVSRAQADSLIHQSNMEYLSYRQKAQIAKSEAIDRIFSEQQSAEQLNLQKQQLKAQQFRNSYGDDCRQIGNYVVC